MKLLKSNAVLEIINSYLVDSPSPSNLSYVWSFGSLLGVCLVLQIISGVILAMHYTANTGLAFESIEHIMRDVNNGWLIRYMHANVASFFFIFVYLHIGKGIYYNSYKAPRLMLWNIGVAIYFMMMAIAFLGIILCLRYKGLELGLELGLLLMPISPELKKRLDEKEIKPIVVFENLETAESKEQIRSEIRGKAGVYGIFNKVTGDLYIGSGVNNNLFARLSNHLYVKRGNKKIARDIAEYGLSSFAYLILEYNLEEITEQNISWFQELELYWIKKHWPSYNYYMYIKSRFGYKHSEETKQKIRAAQSKENKLRISFLQKGKPVSEWVKAIISEKALKRYNKMSAEDKAKIGLISSKAVTLYNKDGTKYKSFRSKIAVAGYLEVHVNTISRYIKSNKLYNDNWYIKLDKVVPRWKLTRKQAKRV